MENGEIRILLVDDEQDILEFLSYNLIREGFQVIRSQNGKEAIQLAHEHKPHLILLDVMMPGMDGIEACEELRKVPALAGTLIVFLTARGEDFSQIAGLEAGADDYLTKPIKPKVLISRIKAMLRRQHAFMQPVTDSSTEPVQEDSNALFIDREKYLVIKDGVQFDLPRKEFELLNLLWSKPDRVYTRDEIFQLVWGEDIVVGERTIDVHIRKLREKIGEEHIQTIKGVGYKYVR